MAQRIGQVRVGSVKIGDVVAGHVVTGFGQSWVLSDEDNSGYGAEPGARVRVCYAYGEKAAPGVPAATIARISAIQRQIQLNEETMRYKGSSTRRTLTEVNTKLRAELETLTAEVSDAN